MRQRAHSARSPRATNALVASKRASAAPGVDPPVVTRSLRASPVPALNMFRLPVHGRIIFTVVAYDGLGDRAASPE